MEVTLTIGGTENPVCVLTTGEDGVWGRVFSVHADNEWGWVCGGAIVRMGVGSVWDRTFDHHVATNPARVLFQSF